MTHSSGAHQCCSIASPCHQEAASPAQLAACLLRCGVGAAGGDDKVAAGAGGLAARLVGVGGQACIGREELSGGTRGMLKHPCDSSR